MDPCMDSFLFACFLSIASCQSPCPPVVLFLGVGLPSSTLAPSLSFSSTLPRKCESAGSMGAWERVEMTQSHHRRTSFKNRSRGSLCRGIVVGLCVVVDGLTEGGGRRSFFPSLPLPSPMAGAIKCFVCIAVNEFFLFLFMRCHGAYMMHSLNSS